MRHGLELARQLDASCCGARLGFGRHDWRTSCSEVELGAASARARPASQPRDEEQVVDEAQQPVRVALDDAEIAALFLREVVVVERELEVAHDRGRAACAGRAR